MKQASPNASRKWPPAMTVGWHWAAALAVLLLVYFYAHYGFASITAHVSAMYIPFLVVIIAAGRGGRFDRAAARLRFKPECVAHPLRDDARTDLVRRGLCKAAHAVVDWLRSFSGQPSNLDGAGIALAGKRSAGGSQRERRLHRSVFPQKRR